MIEPRTREPRDVEFERKSSRSLKQDRSIETREKLVNAAIEVLSEHGYAGFSTLRVAKAAGVTRGALQYHFESREALFFAARLRLAEAMKEKLALNDLFSMPMEERVHAIVNSYWDVIGSSGYVAALEIRLYDRFNEDLHERMSRGMREVSETRDGTWIRVFSDSPLPTEDLVMLRRFMLDCLRGLALRKLEGDPQVSLDRVLDLLVETLISKLQGR